jgi:hypothetical protein
MPFTAPVAQAFTSRMAGLSLRPAGRMGRGKRKCRIKTMLIRSFAPSPSPSPPGRGEGSGNAGVRRGAAADKLPALKQIRHCRYQKVCCRFPLSPRERAGVREKPVKARGNRWTDAVEAFPSWLLLQPPTSLRGGWARIVHSPEACVIHKNGRNLTRVTQT